MSNSLLLREKESSVLEQDCEQLLLLNQSPRPNLVIRERAGSTQRGMRELFAIFVIGKKYPKIQVLVLFLLWSIKVLI